MPGCGGRGRGIGYLVFHGDRVYKGKNVWRWMMTIVAQQYVYTLCHWTVQLNMAKIICFILWDFCHTHTYTHTHIHTIHLKQMWWNGSSIILFSFPIYLQTNSFLYLSKFGLQCILKIPTVLPETSTFLNFLNVDISGEKKNAPTFSLHLLCSFSFRLLTSLGGDLFLVFSLRLLLSFYWEKWASPPPSRKKKYLSGLRHPSFIPCPAVHMIMREIINR